MKRITFSVVILCMACMTLLACSHVHKYGDWDRNEFAHWKICKCGKVDSYDSHHYNDDDECLVCGYKREYSQMREIAGTYYLWDYIYELNSYYKTKSAYIMLNSDGTGKYVDIYESTDKNLVFVPDGYKISVKMEGESYILNGSIREGILNLEWMYYGNDSATALYKENNGVRYGFGLDGNYAAIGMEDPEASSIEIVSAIDDIPVTSIGAWAFEYSNLTNITLPTTIASIGSKAFAGSESLENIVIPDSVTIIEDGVFGGCIGLSNITIGNEVQYIGDNAFNGCNSLLELILPDSVRYFGNGAIADCTKLQNVSVGKGMDVYDEMFKGLVKLTNVTIAFGVSEIGREAFGGCTSLESIYLPDSVKTINQGAFEGCVKLVRATLGNGITRLESRAFWGCKSLRYVTFGDNLNYIGAGAFGECIVLDYNLYDNGMYLGPESNPNKFLFYAVDKAITAITIHEKTQYIFDDALVGCNITEITIPNGVKHIGQYAFGYCRKLKEITVPSSVTDICEGAFSSCSLSKVNYLGDIASWCAIDFAEDANPISTGARLFVNGDEITRLSLPNGIEKVGQNAFYGYSALTELIIPKSLKFIELSAFDECENLTKVSYLGELADWFDIEFYSNPLCNSASLYVNNSKVTKLIIPESVKEIKYNAFMGCDSITEVIIHDDVVSIGSCAFEFCSNLSSVTMGKGVAVIDSYAFAWCNISDSITLPSALAFMGSCAFSGMNAEIIWSEDISITEIWSDAFRYYYGTSLIIPDGVMKIGYSAFQDCDYLTNIIIPESVTSIESYAFAGCISLQSIIIPEEITRIEYRTFSGCDSLESIVIGSKVKYIGDNALSRNLKKIFYKGTPEDWVAITKGSWGDIGGTSAYRYYYSESEPEQNKSDYWHYVDGIPTIW